MNDGPGAKRAIAFFDGQNLFGVRIPAQPITDSGPSRSLLASCAWSGIRSKFCRALTGSSG